MYPLINEKNNIKVNGKNCFKLVYKIMNFYHMIIISLCQLITGN